MRGPRTNACKWCARVYVKDHPRRKGLTKEDAQFCGDLCKTSYAEHMEREQLIAQNKIQLEHDIERARLTRDPVEAHSYRRAREPRTVWCNKCVRRYFWSPINDSSDCPNCQYHLSIYGPFDRAPSWVSPILLPNDRQRVHAV